MRITKWKSIDTFKDRDGTTMVLQQKVVIKAGHVVVPLDEHRVIPAKEAIDG